MGATFGIAFIRSVFAGLCFSLATGVAFGQTPQTSTHGMKFGPEKRLEVVPILFVPSDSKSITSQAVQQISKLVYAHLEIAQRRYKDLLRTDTFKIADGTLLVYHARSPHSHYIPPVDSKAREVWQRAHPGGNDAENHYLHELYESRRDNRYDFKYIYLVIYARPGAQEGTIRTGGGRLNNRFPYSGGGAILVELSSLLSDFPYPFQTTLMHELGHVFGLAHPSCYGYELTSNESIMSYNPKHATKGLTASPGGLNPEDYLVLSQNKLALPKFEYHGAVHNPYRKKMDRIESCYLPPHSEYVGAFRQPPPGSGFELFFNGKRASDGGAEFEIFKTARDACRTNRARRPDIEVECRYNGRIFDPGPAPTIPDLAGAWCDGQPASIAQSGGTLTFTSRGGGSSPGDFASNDFDVNDMIVAHIWATEGLSGFVNAEGTRLDWANGSVWQRGECRR